MKRIIILATVMVFAMTTFAFAVTQVTTYANPVFNASTKVKVFADSSATGSVFAAAAKHLNGNRTFGTASDSTQIFFTETVVAGTDMTSSTFTGDSAGAFSTWTSL